MTVAELIAEQERHLSGRPKDIQRRITKIKTATTIRRERKNKPWRNDEGH